MFDIKKFIKLTKWISLARLIPVVLIIIFDWNFYS